MSFLESLDRFSLTLQKVSAASVCPLTLNVSSLSRHDDFKTWFDLVSYPHIVGELILQVASSLVPLFRVAWPTLSDRSRRRWNNRSERSFVMLSLENERCFDTLGKLSHLPLSFFRLSYPSVLLLHTFFSLDSSLSC